MTLKELGWSPFFESQLTAGLIPARVVEEQRGAIYRVLNESGETSATLTGNFRRESANYPAVGDWVGLRSTTVEQLLERRSRFSRQAAGTRTEEQVVAANIDTLFMMTSLNRDLNAARLERYLTSVWENGATPVVLLSKSDLIDDPDPSIAEMQAVAPGVTVLAISAVDGSGLDALAPFLYTGQTVALVGSSGVGKSTLVNRLLGSEMQDVGEIRENDDRGRHTTTARRLIPLPAGGLLLDTPGMRELQLWEGDSGIEQVFPEIDALAESCRFRDCRHEAEPGCAVRQAIADEHLDPRRMESFRKLEKELEFAARKQDAALRAEQNKKWKQIHKAQRVLYRTRPKGKP